MKTNSKYFLMTVLLAVSSIYSAKAQNFYNVGDTIRRNDFTYMCEERSGIMLIHSINNVLTDVKQQKLNGEPVEGSIFQSNNPKPYTEPTSIDLIFHNIINMEFSKLDKLSAQNDILLVSVYLDSTTGRVREVQFEFNKMRNGFADVSSSVYYAIEQKIRKYVYVELTPLGRSYNYNLRLIPYNGKLFDKPPLNPSLYP